MHLRTVLASLSLALLVAPPARANLDEFLAKPEPAYRWEKKGEKTVSGCTVTELFLVSQEWHGKPWEHRLFFIRPEKVEFPSFCSLYNAGGKGGDDDVLMGTVIAKKSGACCAMLFGVPSQPLWDKSEDALVVHTWLEFMASMKKDGKGDESWPLHFPMAKSVIKGMDAVQEHAKKEGLPAIDSFVICGASKRGWTTWLVGASGDPRVKAIAPMVIDCLNVVKQAEHQLSSYGRPSEQVHDYTAAGMMQMFATPEGKRLLELEDPWSYRERLVLPKLIICGTNDRYWTQDALNIYWDDLKGPKWVLYVPNSGHGLEDRSRVLSTMAAFVRGIAKGGGLPGLSWSYASTKDGGAVLGLKSDVPMEEARLFHASAKTKDFRNSKWQFDAMAGDSGSFKASIDGPTEGWLVAYGEAVYSIDGIRFTISSQLRIMGAAEKKKWY